MLKELEKSMTNREIQKKKLFLKWKKSVIPALWEAKAGGLQI